MPLIPGSRLGPYEIVASLGAGGMGEVWRARDTRLGREVAVKVLAAHLVAQPEVRARFEREARAISSLNHPHICVLHDVGRDGDTDYLVMELVEGETLARRLKRGPLPVADALRIGAQIADALDRAHRSGIVHRDLKPGNVMLAKNGAKLMDFGLARAQAETRAPVGPAGDMSISPTMSRPLTAEGTIVGTFQYMAPEQLEGAEVDARSDVWAFGCVLYEMLSGRAPFEGRSQASLISSIMKDEPRPLAGSGAGAALGDLPPPQLDRLVRRCLAKDPDERWQTASDLKHELQWMSGAALSAPSGASAAAPGSAAGRARRAARSGWIVGVTGVLIAALTLIAAGLAMRSARDARLVRFTIEEPAGMELSTPAEPALSPDGSRLVFAGDDSTAIRRLFVRELGSPELRVLPGTRNASLPFWSPDSRSIGFFMSGTLWKLSLDGGAPVALCPAPDARGGAWSPKGVIVFAPAAEGPIQRVSADGGTPREITRIDRPGGERGHRYPCFLPDGRHFLFTGVRSSEPHPWYIGDIEGRPARRIGEGITAPVWSPDGYLLWNESRRVLARRFSPGSGRFSGEPRVLVSGVYRDNFSYPNLTAAGRGLAFVQHLREGNTRLFWKSPSAPETPAFAGELPVLGYVSLSNDGRRVVYDSDAGGSFQLWLQELDGGAAVRITSDEGGTKASMIWSPDDRKLLYSRAVGRSGYEVRMLDFDSGEDSLFMRPSGTFAFATGWTAQGEVLICASDSTGTSDLWVAPADRSAPPRLLRRTPQEEFLAILSADGRWLVTQESFSGRTVLAVQRWPQLQPRAEMTVEAGADGAIFGLERSTKADEFLIVDGRGDLYAIAIVPGPPLRFGVPRRVGTLPLSIAVLGLARRWPDFLVARRQREGRISNLEGVVNWTRLLERR